MTICQAHGEIQTLGMGFAAWPGAVDHGPDRPAAGESLPERPGADELFGDPGVFGIHVAEAVLFARLPHDPSELLLADIERHSVKS